MKILFLSFWFPYPPINGVKIRIYNLSGRIRCDSRKKYINSRTPYEYANAVLNVLQNPELRKILSQEGRKLLKEKYSSSVMGINFNSLLESVVYSTK